MNAIAAANGARAPGAAPTAHGTRAPDAQEVALADKLAFLGRASSYPDSPAGVLARETHMSWVFLAGPKAYKLKKPVRYDYLDYRTLDRRRQMCEQEVLLNRRLAADVYEGVAALVRGRDGGLALIPAGRPLDGEAVEWLVQMRRLPDELMLDRAIARNTARHADAERAAAHLAAFFMSAPRCARTVPEHSAALRRAIAQSAAAITALGAAHATAGGITQRGRLPPIEPIMERQFVFIDARRALLEQRVTAGRIVEGHGDLRPEHVFLGEPPAVIDCIEFDRELRLVDPLEELAFLRMECARLGGERWGELFLETWLRTSGDLAAEPLLAFYVSLRACVRARLALGHLEGRADTDHWLAKAQDYLEIAGRHAARL
ncbi:MAG: hypothetical protein IRZ06_11765 [Nevskia sp.]|nr:hypothetical protein [Nevskia sp.]